MKLVARPNQTCHSSRLRSGVLAAAITMCGGVVAGISPFALAADPVDDPKIAIRAVQATLPSVAILGQKAGPADTTEVFIQVPGVLNMQSVYVLDDGKTVISGVVVPPIEDGFPGSQLSMPDGQASVNPRAPRDGVEQLNQVLGVQGAQSSTVDRAQDSSATEKEQAFNVPKLPKRAEGNKDEVSVASGKVQRLPEPAEPAPAPTVAAEEEGSGSAPAPSNEESFTAENGEILIKSLADVAESGAFSQVVGHMLQNDNDIDMVRNLSNKAAQQAGYLDLVKSRPAIVQGDSDKRVYALFDPNCPVCHRYYNEVSALADSGRVEVHWIPAIVFPDNRSSLTASAALMAETQREGGDALAMLDNMMTKQGFTQKVDSAPNVDRLTPYLDGVVKNTAVMAMARAETPLLVFENAEGNLSINPGIPPTGYEKMIKSEG